MGKMVYTEQTHHLTAERLGDFARSVPSEARVSVKIETKPVETRYSVNDEEFVTFEATF